MRDLSFCYQAVKKPILVLGILTLLITTVNASEIFNIQKSFDYESQNQIKFNISNNTDLNNSELFITNPNKFEKNYGFEYSGNNTFRTQINYSDKGVYRYKVVSDNYSYPSKGKFSFSIPSYNNTLKNISTNLTDSNSTNDAFCNFRQNDSQTGEEKDFTCEYENFQAWMMASQAIAYYSTGNNSFKQRSLKFATQNYSSSVRTRLTCPHSENDFNCEDDADGDNIDVSSGMRQGSLIDSLWTVYSITNNETVRKLAKNYTSGSAESCDVYGSKWNESFNCKTPEGQGSMMLGYWEAYENTGNETYREIAENLSSTNKSSPRIARGLWEQSRITDNQTSLEKAENMTKYYLSECSENCSTLETSETLLSLWKGYLSTEDYGYYRNGIKMLNSYSNKSCNPFGNKTQCSLPNGQGLTIIGSWKTYQNQKDDPERFNNPIKKGNISDNNSINLEIGMEGKLTNPRLKLANSNTTCKLDFFDRSCNFKPEELGSQNSFSYYYSSNSTRFPENGSFKFLTNFRQYKYFNESENILSRNPLTLCSPWDSDNDTTCFNEIDQAFMMQGFNSITSIQDYSNYSGIRDDLAYGRWDASNCNAYNNSFSCNTTTDSEGSYLQGNLINTFYDLYSSTENKTALVIAENYTKGNAEDCNVWDSKFKCNSSRGQGAMINGYWKAYKTTGNDTYLEIAENLSKRHEEFNKTSELGSSLWKVYSVTNNSSYREKAKNITENTSCKNCSIINFSAAGNLFRGAYKYGTRAIDSFKNLVDIGPINQSCNPINNSYNCEEPREQGILGKSYIQAFNTIPRPLNASIEIEGSKNVKKGDGLEMTCTVQNTAENTTLFNSKPVFNSSSGIEKTSNSSVNLTNLNYNSSINISSSFEATESGSQEVKCILNTTSNLDKNSTFSVTVEEEKDDSGGDSGGSDTGGALLGSLFEPYQINYSFDRLMYRTDLFKNSNISEVIENDYKVKSSCFRAERNIYENHSTTEFANYCNTSDIVIFEHLPENVAPKTSHNFYKNYTYFRKNNISDNFSVNYTGSPDEDEWNLPIPLFLVEKDPKPLRINLSDLEINESSLKGSGNIRLNKKTDCTIRSNSDTQTIENRSLIELDFDVKPGNNSLEVKCGNKTKNHSFTVESDDKDDEKNSFIPEITVSDIAYSLAFLTLLSIPGLAIYKRELIVTETRAKVANYYSNKLFDNLESGNPGAAVESYEKLKKYSQNTEVKDIIGSETDIDRGTYLYLSLDAIKEAKEENIEISKSRSVIKDAVEYVEENPSENISSKLKEKLAEINVERLS